MVSEQKTVKNKKQYIYDEDFFEQISKLSPIGVHYVGKKFTDKFKIWILFSLAIFVIMLSRTIISLHDVGSIARYSEYSVPFENVTQSNKKDIKYLHEDEELFEKKMGKGPMEIEFWLSNTDAQFNNFYSQPSFCDGTTVFLGMNDAET